MHEVTFVLLAAGFFALAAAYVRACAAIVGREATQDVAPAGERRDAPEAAG